MMLAIFGVPGTIATWWLVVFTRPRVKHQFTTEANGMEQAAAPMEVLPTHSTQTRPVSVAVISLLLMAAADGLGMMIPLHRFVWSIGLPALILGIKLIGYKAVVVMPRLAC